MKPLFTIPDPFKVRLKAFSNRQKSSEARSFFFQRATLITENDTTGDTRIPQRGL